jgi:catechol 2,3-dioxygenase-like lactoylglutathione lyase family enzyme
VPLFLDHTIVPAHDKEESARFLARILGLEYKGMWGHFAPVKVNDTLSLDFDNRENFERHHYAFLASDEDFDAILGRVKAEGIPFRSGPNSENDNQINHLHGGRGFYFADANGHSWEVITHTYV